MTAAVEDDVDDPVAAFYDHHPYPPPVADLDAFASGVLDAQAERVEHHRVWPRRAVGTVGSVLVAGCGTSQAVRHALRRPAARVVGIDVSETAVEHTRRLAARHGVDNLEVHRLPLEDVDELGERFDHVVCTGVLHHLADPAAGLTRLREALAPGGALSLMVYARYGRVGVYMLQEYCRRLGITPSTGELTDLVASLRELPLGHPLSRLLRETRDFHDDDALADALLNPRDRAYSVPELFDLLAGSGLRFGRWALQAPYLPDCGSISETPHAARISALSLAEQFAAVELFRGTITRHTVIAFDQADQHSGHLDFADSSSGRWRPIRVPTAITVQERSSGDRRSEARAEDGARPSRSSGDRRSEARAEDGARPSRLPPGAAAALLNRAHTSTDLVLFATGPELEIFRRIDGDVTIGELGAAARPFVERLFRHDLVVIDASSGVTT